MAPVRFPMPDEPKLGPCEGVRDLVRRHRPFWRRYHEAMVAEKAFSRGDRYQNPSSHYSKDRRDIQIIGDEIPDTCRHVAAKLTEHPRSIEARLKSGSAAEGMSEIAVGLVEWDTNKPELHFDDELEKVIQTVCEMRQGFMTMDYDPDLQERIYSWHDPTKEMHDPAYDLHHPLCGWMLLEKRMPVERARREFKAPWLKPDRESAHNVGGNTDLSVEQKVTDLTLTNPEDYDDQRVTLWYCWYKNDYTEKEAPEPLDYTELDPEQRRMECVSCGQSSETQGEMRAAGVLDDYLREQGIEAPDVGAGQPAPDMGLPEQMTCPMCQGTMKRTDATEQEAYMRRYTNGKRLVIMAPLCPNPGTDESGEADAPLYDGDWPQPELKSYPILWVTCEVEGGRPMGGSYVTRMRSSQIAFDNLRTLFLQRMFEYRNYWMMPADGIENIAGDRFEFRDDDGNVMFVSQDRQEFGPLNVESKASSGLDPSASFVYGIIESSLMRFRPQLDVGSQEDTRDIPVGTIELQQKEAEVTTSHLGRRINRALGLFYTLAVYPSIKATLTPAQQFNVRVEGQQHMLDGLDGSTMPDYEFFLTDNGPLSGSDRRRAQQSQWIVQTLADPATAPYFEELAEAQGISSSLMRRFLKKRDEIKAEQQMATQQQAAAGMLPPEGGGGPGEPLPPEAPEPMDQPAAFAA